MDLRMLEITVPNEAVEKARGFIEESPILGIWEVPLAGDEQSLFRALVETKHSQSLLDRMEHHFVRANGEGRLALLPVRATVPPPTGLEKEPLSRLARWRRKK